MDGSTSGQLTSTNLSILRHTRLFDIAEELEYERIVGLASAIGGTATALVLLFDGHSPWQDSMHPWFKARTGLCLNDIAHIARFCCGMIHQTAAAVVVEDLSRNPYADVGRVIVNGHPYGFYAGVPIHIGNGRLLVGGICLMDGQPRSLSPERLADLIALGRVVEASLSRKIEAEYQPRAYRS